ncbi:hypothetical protein Vretimale_13334 [Volvox reticuliferus]|uniref:Uncharacterized protein n=1 Tax=Volvox reticuliferus TaxID=1737510 RepID=A0A8J4GLC6_9CHLO|nr:hypothetical protein Vretimale_13334 [Volvox reticuliferus]
MSKRDLRRRTLRDPWSQHPPWWPPPPLPMSLTAASAAGGNDSGQKDSDGGRAGDGNDSQPFQRAIRTPRDTVDFSAGEANMLQTNGDGGGAGQIRSGEVSGSASAPLPYMAAAIDVATAGIYCMDWLPSSGGRDSMPGNIDGAQPLGLQGSGVRLLSAPQLQQPPGPAVGGALDSSSSAALYSSSGGGGHGQGNNSAAEAHLRLVSSSPFQRATAYVTADVPVPPPYLLEPVKHDQQQRQFPRPNVQLGCDSHFHGQQLQPSGQPPNPQRSNVPPSAVSPAYHPGGSCEGGSCRGIFSSGAVQHTGGLSLNYSAADLPECSQLQPQQPLSLPVQNSEQLLQRRSLHQQQQVIIKEHHAAPIETSSMARATGMLLSQPLQQSMAPPAPQYLGMQNQLQVPDDGQYFQSPKQLPPSQPPGQQSNRPPQQLISISGANLLPPSGAAGASLPYGIADNQPVSLPYNSTQLLQRLSFKLHGCSPSDLMPDSRAKLQSWLKSMSLQMLQYTTRSGCTLIIADVLVPAAAAAAAAGCGNPNRWLLARIVEGLAAGQGPGFADAAAAVPPLPPLPQSPPVNDENLDLSGMGLRDPPHSASSRSEAVSPYQKGSKRPSTATGESSREGGAYVDVDMAGRSDGHGRALALKFGVECTPTSDDTDRTSDASTGSSTGMENEGSGIGGDSRHDNSDTPHDVSSGGGVGRDYSSCDAIAGKAPDLMDGCQSPSELVPKQLAAPQGPAAAAAAATTDDDAAAAAAAAAVTSPPTAAEVAAAVSSPPTVSAFRPMGQVGGPILELLRILLGPLVAQPNAGEMGAVTDQALLIQLEDQVVCMTWPRRLTADQRVVAAGADGDGNAARGEHVTSGAGDPLLAAGGKPLGQHRLETLAAAGVRVTPPPPTLVSVRPAAVTAGQASSLRVMIRLPSQSPLGNAVSGTHGGDASAGCGQGPPVMLHLRYNGACVLSCELQPGDLRPVTGGYGAPTEVTDTQRQLFQERQVPEASDTPSDFPPSPRGQKPSVSAGDVDLPDQPAGSRSQRWPLAAATMELDAVENQQLPAAAAEAEAPAIQMTSVSSLAVVSEGAGADAAVCPGGHADAGIVVEYTLHVPSLTTPGLAFVETSCGDVLGPWMPLPVVPSEAAAEEMSSLTHESSLLHLFLCDVGRLLMLSAAGDCLEEAGYTDDWDAYEAYCELRDSIPDAEVVAGRLLRKCIEWRLPECTALSTSLFLGVVDGAPL